MALVPGDVVYNERNGYYMVVDASSAINPALYPVIEAQGSQAVKELALVRISSYNAGVADDGLPLLCYLTPKADALGWITEEGILAHFKQTGLNIADVLRNIGEKLK